MKWTDGLDVDLHVDIFCISYTVLLDVALIFVEKGKKCIPVALSVIRLFNNCFENGFSIFSVCIYLVYVLVLYIHCSM